jgi:hypothetical protein
LQIDAIILDGLKKFPNQDKTLELCKWVISLGTPDFCDAITSKTLSVGRIRAAMDSLLEYILRSNESENESFRLNGEVRRSDEWKKLVIEAASAAKSKNGSLPFVATPSTDESLKVEPVGNASSLLQGAPKIQMPPVRREASEQKRGPHLAIPTASELRSKKAIPQRIAAQYFGCTVRTIHNYLKKMKLKQTKDKLVCCDDSMIRALRDRYGESFQLN